MHADRSICPSGKTFYYNEEAAIEALIEALGMGEFPAGLGPSNVYCCNVCEGYHLTSKAERNPILDQEPTKRRIETLRRQHKLGF